MRAYAHAHEIGTSGLLRGCVEAFDCGDSSCGGDSCDSCCLEAASEAEALAAAMSDVVALGATKDGRPKEIGAACLPSLISFRAAVVAAAALLLRPPPSIHQAGGSVSKHPTGCGAPWSRGSRQSRTRALDRLIWAI